MNLFLAGHGSGCIYLYDATNQSQPTVAPIFSKLYQDEAFSIYLNQHASTCPQVNVLAMCVGDTLGNDKKPSQSSQSSSSRKLYLASGNQQPSQVAKNPLLKWTIGVNADTSRGDNQTRDVYLLSIFKYFFLDVP